MDLLKAFGLSERRACRLVQANRSTVRYRSVKPEDTVLRQRIKELEDEVERQRIEIASLRTRLVETFASVSTSLVLSESRLRR